jgi:pyruvate formate lyase activating enzyme
VTERAADVLAGVPTRPDATRGVRPPSNAPAATDAHSLAIAGVEPFSSCDWPGHLTATLFLQGCPWQCTYCHNVSIIDSRTPGKVTWDEVLDLVTPRVGLLDGVVFSGGEPTRQAGLADAMRQVRDLGHSVGLHTCGAFPRRLSEIVNLVDWVGLDIKAPTAKYPAITQVANSAAPAYESLRLLLDAGVDLQVRTTVDPMILTPKDVASVEARMAELGVADFVVQEVRTDGTSAEFAAGMLDYRRGLREGRTPAPDA